MINFCHISPTKHLDTFCSQQTHHLLLAHLVEDDGEYADWYANKKTENKDLVYILDNSGFERYKAGLPIYPSHKLLEIGSRVGADYIVMSDSPGEHSWVTIQAAIALAPKFHRAGFGTMFVPQSRIGDVEDYISAFAWAASSPLVDYIGVSILGVPNAYGVESGNKLQRFFSRWYMMCVLERRGILDLAIKNRKKIHFLGMVDGPNEIQLCKMFPIDTWDSSAAVWAGLNGIEFDQSPTGLIDGKFEVEVDFSAQINDINKIAIAKRNIQRINDLCGSSTRISNPPSISLFDLFQPLRGS